MKKFYGVTLIELMVGIALLAILASFAIPSYNYLVTNNRITTQTNRLLATLLYSRSEAAKRGVDVVTCWTDAPAADPPACGGAAGSGWKDGWIVFVDNDGDDAFDVGEVVLRRESAIEGGNTIDSDEDSVTYQPDGSIKTTKAALDSFNFCDAENNPMYTRSLRLVLSGRPRVQTTGSCP